MESRVAPIVTLFQIGVCKGRETDISASCRSCCCSLFANRVVHSIVDFFSCILYRSAMRSYFFFAICCYKFYDLWTVFQYPEKLVPVVKYVSIYFTCSFICFSMLVSAIEPYIYIRITHSTRQVRSCRIWSMVSIQEKKKDGGETVEHSGLFRADKWKQ